MGSYFRDIYLGVTTILAGMWVTLRHLFLPTVTVQYPREKVVNFPRTRARLYNYEPECGVCLSCQRVCPADCFTIKGVRADKDEDLGILPDGKPKRMHLVQFDINTATCLFCGLCVDSCDTGSLRWMPDQETPVFNRDELLRGFVSLPQEEIDRLLAKEAARKAARAAEAAKKGAKPGVRPGGKPVGKPQGDGERKEGDRDSQDGKEPGSGDDAG